MDDASYFQSGICMFRYNFCASLSQQRGIWDSILSTKTSVKPVLINTLTNLGTIMRYRDLLIVERRRSEKGIPRVHKDTAKPEELERFRENAVKDLARMAQNSGVDINELYISYTGLDKIGINPVSGYNTPIGVYCYPLRYALERMKAADDPSAVPYMGTQPHIWLFTPKNPDRGLNISQYNENQLNADMDRVRDFLVKQGLDVDYINQSVQEAFSNAKRPANASEYAAMFWNATRVLGKDFGKFKRNKTHPASMLKVGDFVSVPEYTGYGANAIGMVVKKHSDMLDIKLYTGSGKFGEYPMTGIPIDDVSKVNPPAGYTPDFSATPTNPTAITGPDPEVGDIVAIISGPFKDFTATITGKEGSEYLMNVSIYGKNTPIKLSKENLEVTQKAPKPSKPEPDNKKPDDDDMGLIDLAFEPEPESIFSFKKESIIREENNLQTRAKTSIIEWNRLMRVAGYDYIVDPADSGLIHPDEPTQAVFLSGAYLTTIGKIRNTAKNIKVRPPYTTDQINRGKYDPITFERWLKNNYKSYREINWLYPDSVSIQSEKLINKLVTHDDFWISVIDGASSRYGHLVVKAKATRLAKLVNDGEDEYSINRAIRDLENVYTGNPKDVQVADAAFLKNPKFIMEYIEQIKRGRWPEAESAIAQDPKNSFFYASRILRKPWPDGEDAISQNAEMSYLYASNVLHERFPKGESRIANDPNYAADYAIRVMDRPWPEAEPAIELRSSALRRYRKRFPLFDDVSKLKPGDQYAETISGLRVLVIIANTPESADWVEVHNMYQRGKLDSTPIEFIATIKENRYGFELGKKYKINQDGDMAMLVAIENNVKYIFMSDNQNVEVMASEVFEFNKKDYKKPADFAIGDIVSFGIDHWGDGPEEYSGQIVDFPEPGQVELIYGVWNDKHVTSIQDIKHHVGKYKK
jgi:hypothetical protein